MNISPLLPFFFLRRRSYFDCNFSEFEINLFGDLREEEEEAKGDP